MALPEGVTTCTVTAGVPVTHTGAPVKAFVSIEPSVFLVHTATGTPLVDFLEELSINEGVAGQFTLPHTDQAGFQDENGNAYTNWYYTARISYSTPSKAKTKAPKIKVFQLAAGQTLVDLDALPGGAPALPYTAPIAVPTSFNGRTGAITLEDADLPERLSDASLTATIDDKGNSARVASLGARGPLQSALNNRDTLPVAIVFAGSSTVRGHTTEAPARWINRIGAKVSPNPVNVLTATPPTAPGIHLINAGVNGATAGDYITATTRPQILAHNPALIVHSVGSNDWANDITAATYETNLRNQIAALNAAATSPLGHILMHSYQRYDVTKTVPWESFRLAMTRIASEFDNVAVIDLSQDFAALGIPSTDPSGLMMTDKIHMNDKGHAAMANLMGDYLALPAAPAPVPSVPLVLDLFNRADGAMGNAITGQAWSALGGTFTVAGRRAVPSVGSSMTVVNLGTVEQDVTVEMDITSTTTNAGLVFRALDADNRWALLIDMGTKRIQLWRRVAGVQTTPVLHDLFSIALGWHTLRVVAKGRTIRAYYDGVVAFTYSLSLSDYTDAATWTLAGLRSVTAADPKYGKFYAQTAG